MAAKLRGAVRKALGIVEQCGSRQRRGSVPTSDQGQEQEPLIPNAEAPPFGGATVTFEPGARTAWHTHPLGQTLIVTSGLGWARRGGGPREEIRPGDIVWFAPGEKHWHGATDSTAMTHIAIAEAVDGSPVTWLEKVSDEDYTRP